MSHTSRFSPVQDCDDSLATVHNWNRTPEMRAYIKELFMSAALCASLCPLPPPYHSTVCSPNLYTYIFHPVLQWRKAKSRNKFVVLNFSESGNLEYYAVSLDERFPTFWRIVVPSSSGRNLVHYLLCYSFNYWAYRNFLTFVEKGDTLTFRHHASYI